MFSSRTVPQRARIPLAAASGVVGLALAVAGAADAQPFQPGDEVQASPMALQSSWQTCTVNGRTPGGDYDVNCRGVDYVVPQKWIRSAPQPEPAPPRPAAPPPAAAPAPRVGQVRTRPQPGADRAGCPADGTVVTDRSNRTGPIIGVANGLCVFRLGDGSTRSTLAWMLTPAGGTRPADGGGAGLAPGTYVCSMSAAGGMFRITIKNGSQYVDRAGATGTYAVQGKRVTFNSGSLRGQHSEILGPGKFGLSTTFNGMFYGVCNRQ